MKKLLIAILLTGCVNFTEEEKEWRNAVDCENWNMCMSMAENAHIMTTHYDHQERHHEPGDYYIYRDLKDNNCRTLVGRKYWVEY